MIPVKRILQGGIEVTIRPNVITGYTKFMDGVDSQSTGLDFTREFLKLWHKLFLESRNKLHQFLLSKPENEKRNE